MNKNVCIAVALPAKPDQLYDMYLDPKVHAAFTGKPVVIAARSGARFSAFDGVLTGTILHVAPKKQIVQTWRSVNFPKDSLDSILILTFFEETQGARIEINHINVPECDYAGVCHGWEEFYFEPWRAYLSK